MKTAAGAKNAGSKQSTLPTKVSAMRKLISDLRLSKKRDLAWGSVVAQMRAVRLEHQRYPQLPVTKLRALNLAVPELLRLLDGVQHWNIPLNPERLMALNEFSAFIRTMQQHYADQQADP